MGDDILTLDEMTEGALADLKAVQDYCSEMRSVEERQRRLLAHAAMTTVERVQRNLDALHGEFWSISGEDSDELERDFIEIEVPQVEYKRADPLHRGAIVLHRDRTDDLNAAMLLLAESDNLLTAILDLDPDSPAWPAMAKDVHRRVRKALKRLDKQEQADKDVYLALAETQRS